MEKTFGKPILIFDGVCELCNASVDFIMKWEKSPKLLFTANENLSGKAILEGFGENPEDVSTVFLVENGKLYKRSTAALRIAKMLRFPWFLFYAFILVPPFIRDFFYKIIAKNRYRWYGKKDSCRIPTQDEIARFLIE